MMPSNARWPLSIVKLAGCSGSSEFHFLVLISSWTNIFWGGGWQRGDSNTWLIWSHITILQSPLSHDIYLRESKACRAVAGKNQEAIPSNTGDRKAYSHFVLRFLFRCSWPGGIFKGLTGKQSEAEMLLLKRAGLFTSLCCLPLKPLLIIGGQQSPMAPIGFKMH